MQKLPMNDFNRDMKKVKAFYEVVSANFPEFFHGTVIDACSGNGLLGWYVLSQHHDMKVIAIDKKETEKAKQYRALFPDAEHQYAFQQIDITKQPLPEADALVALHACGTLTDMLMEHAMKEHMPFAIMPCCYSKDRHYFPGNGGFAFQEQITHERLLFARGQYADVKLLHIDDAITPMNAILGGVA
ncbi:methyltransferase [Candidatus Woesearchaeota archaeon]|nr:MAG: methyltransferase [Candidatus Woesearchaeota archaeon]